jgi:hypothetical protein
MTFHLRVFHITSQLFRDETETIAYRILHSALFTDSEHCGVTQRVTLHSSNLLSAIQIHVEEGQSIGTRSQKNLARMAKCLQTSQVSTF